MKKPFKKSIYLCGFMGCGKSYLGKKLANDLNMQFIDLDEYIVKNEGMSIPDIFDKYGEGYFRKLEVKYIRKLNNNYVVATGGGAMINNNTSAFAKENGSVVFLNASFEICYNRIKNDKNRPLVMNNTKSQLLTLYEKRKPIYKKNSSLIINADNDEEAVINNIKKGLYDN